MPGAQLSTYYCSIMATFILCQLDITSDILANISINLRPILVISEDTENSAIGAAVVSFGKINNETKLSLEFFLNLFFFLWMIFSIFGRSFGNILDDFYSLLITSLRFIWIAYTSSLILLSSLGIWSLRLLLRSKKSSSVFVGRPGLLIHLADISTVLWNLSVLFLKKTFSVLLAAGHLLFIFDLI